MVSPIARLRNLWLTDPKGMALDLLRVGIGLVWTLNLLFILAPSNGYFAGFQGTAAGFQSTTLGGPWFAGYVAAHATFFAWAIALLTGYLAFAFLAGFTTRLACFVGEIASAAFLITQFGNTFNLTGAGTDVGPHPLYILIYLILFAGGAGQYVAIDHWIWKSGHARLPRLSQWLASPYLVDARHAVALTPSTAGDASSRPAAVVASALVPSEQRFYNTIAVVAVLVVLASFGAAYYGGAAAPAAPGTPSAVETSHVYITITINPGNGMPQYSPANFTVPAGQVQFTIIDQDAPVTWAGCTCNVTGTVGGLEYVNGSPLTVVNNSNAAHTFTIPTLGLNTIMPGAATTTFTLELTKAGIYTWYCDAPCGSMGYTGPPMGVPGYMVGSMTVA